MRRWDVHRIEDEDRGMTVGFDAWTTDRASGRAIDLRLLPVDGRLECVSIQFWALIPGAVDGYTGEEEPAAGIDPVLGDVGPLRAAEVRSLPLGTLVEEAIEAVNDYLEDLTARAGDIISMHPSNVAKSPAELAGPTARMVRDLEQVKRFDRSERRRGRPPLSTEFLREVADYYRHRFNLGSRTPTKDVADHYSVSETTAAGWVRRCRSDKYKFLPKTEQRKPKA